MHNTHTSVTSSHVLKALPDLHASLLDIVAVINHPEQDEQLLKMAGLSLERALFPLLVLIERRGPIGVVDLAARVGRDHTTVSRQVARLEALKLVERKVAPTDKRSREAWITPAGKVATDAVDAARAKLAINLFDHWSRNDFDQLVKLLRMLADGLERKI